MKPHPFHTLSASFDALTEAVKTQTAWLQAHMACVTKSDLETAIRPLVMNQTELAAALVALTEKEGKIAKEQSDRFDALTAKINDLTTALGNAGAVSQEVTDALAGLQSAAQSLDDAIPDAPAPVDASPADAPAA